MSHVHSQTGLRAPAHPSVVDSALRAEGGKGGGKKKGGKGKKPARKK